MYTEVHLTPKPCHSAEAIERLRGITLAARFPGLGGGCEGRHGFGGGKIAGNGNCILPPKRTQNRPSWHGHWP
jgi:hypothetical protein